MRNELIHSLERSIVICATRSTVFRFFTDSKRFSDWWGQGSQIEGRPGGNVLIRHPNGVLVSGEVIEIQEPDKIVFTYGYNSGSPIPPGKSLVTVTLKDHPDGTELTLRHEFADVSARDLHVQGWRYQLALFANVASQDQHSDVAGKMDRYFELWNTKDSASRLKKMRDFMDSTVSFKDKHSCTLGLDDLNAHLDGYQRFMPGMILRREGDPKECQGTVLVRWIADKEDGTRVASGLNVIVLSPEGEIRQVTGFWD